MHSLLKSRILLLVALCLLAPTLLRAQASGDSEAEAPGRILLVLPFDNLTETTTSANLDWLREAAPEILNSRFTSAGFFPLTREDRLYALDHLGLPEGFLPSRATALRIAQTLDADSILIGSYSATGSKLTLKARIVDVARLRISDEVTETGEIAQLIPLLNSLAWQLTRKLDPRFSVAEETFRAAGARLRLDAFEQYIRGITEPTPDERLRHLKKAAELSPDFIAGWLAIGKLQFSTQQYEQAAVSFAKVPATDPAELEAGFYRGLALMFTGNYTHAEEAFATVARMLPLPEVVNNQAVAISRRGKDAIALFRQAQAADPTEPDYRFNLAVNLYHHGDRAEALKELAAYLELRPNDSEAKAAQESWKEASKSAPDAAPSTATSSAGTANPASSASSTSSAPSGPLERLKRSYNGAAFRQAALMLEQVEAARLAALPAAERAARLSRSAHEKLDRGLLLEAERGFQEALNASDRSAEAHAGLAQVRERSGDLASARTEARAALDRQPTNQVGLDAYLVLARLDLAANQVPQALEEVTAALKLDPASRPAKDLKKSIESLQQSLQQSVAAPKP